MLGALGALIRKDERTLFNKHTDGLYVSAPKLLQEIEEDFTEELGYEIQRKLLERWPFENNDLKILFETSRLRILYTSEESHEWVLYNESIIKEEDGQQPPHTPSKNLNNATNNNSSNSDDYLSNDSIINDLSNYMDNDDHFMNINSKNNELNLSEIIDSNENDLICLAGVYQKFNFEFGDGKFHDIVSMGSTTNVGWNVLSATAFDPLVLNLVGDILNLQSKMTFFTDNNCRLPMPLWHIIMGFAVDCFEPISKMMEVDIVLRDVRRWTQNLYLSENLRRRDELGDTRIRKLGQLFIEIGGMIDQEYIKYRKQFSLRKKFVRFMKHKLQNISSETASTFKKLKSVSTDLLSPSNSGANTTNNTTTSLTLQQPNHNNNNGNGVNNGNNDKKSKKKSKKKKNKKRRKKKKRRRKEKLTRIENAGSFSDNNNNNEILTYSRSTDFDDSYKNRNNHSRHHTIDVGSMGNHHNLKLFNERSF